WPGRGDFARGCLTIGSLVAGRAQDQTWLTPPRDWDRWDVKGLLEAVQRGINAGVFSGPGEPAPGMHPARTSMRVNGGRGELMIGQLDPRVAERWDLPAETYIGEVD